MENLRLFLSQKPQFKLEKKIKNNNKKCTSASLFQSSEDGKQEKKFMWPSYILLILPIGEYKRS